ncbi:glycosyl hydrolase family 28-related protein [Aestuariimicrobium soli]|uniref:glycosyl hydrolase family 28-related protein n=1 Tax=Aestuariimicrobium soli TaxID=2035834 RepID=UPI003EBB5A45
MPASSPDQEQFDRLAARLDDLEARGGALPHPEAEDVRRHGAVGDGATDDTEAVEAACRAAGRDGTVFFGRGRFLVTRRIVLPLGQQWQGPGIAETGPGEVPTHAILTRVPDGPAIEASYNTVFRSLRIEGDGTGHGMVLRGSVRFDEVSLQGYDLAISCDKLWYGHLQGLRLYRNRVGLRVDIAYNLTLIAPRINCSDVDGVPGVGIELAHNVDLKIFGGAIEAYRVGIRTGNQDSVHLHSVYFESNAPRPEALGDDGAVGVQLSGTRSTTVTALGCYVYLTHHAAWIDADVVDTTGSLVAMGNTFKGGNPRGDRRNLAYRWANGSAMRVSLTGDQWTQVQHKDNASYLAPGSALPLHAQVSPPPGSRATDPVNQVRALASPFVRTMARVGRRVANRLSR